MPKPGIRKKSKERKGKKPHKNKLTSKKYLKYGSGKSKHCPRCGPGIFLGVNEDRIHCGKCHYTEFIKTKS